VSGEDVGLHWGAILLGIVSFLLILGSPVFANEEYDGDLKNLQIEGVYTDDGLVAYPELEGGRLHYPTPEDLELEESDTITTIYSERKLYMPYNVYYL
jgi:hypothetical protein